MEQPDEFSGNGTPMALCLRSKDAVKRLKSSSRHLAKRNLNRLSRGGWSEPSRGHVRPYPVCPRPRSMTPSRALATASGVTLAFSADDKLCSNAIPSPKLTAKPWSMMRL